MSTRDDQARDLVLYEEELRDFLPERIFDAHVHLFDATCLVKGAAFKPRHPYQKFGGVFTVEQYEEWMKRLLPAQEIHFNSFGHPEDESDREASAAYTGRISDNRQRFGMALVSPADPVEAVVQRVEQNNLIGYKPYPSFVKGKPVAAVTIFDMLPEPLMREADARGWAVMLHIPRPGRLADPINQVQMVELCQRYPTAKIIFAHIGRAYYLNSVLGALEGIAACPNAYLDTAMINHEGVLEYAFSHFPRERILFGADAPFALLRGKSVEINDQYAYLLGENYAMGTAIYDAEHAVTFTSFFYEQLRGIKLAAERAGLSRNEIKGFFFDNAHQVFDTIAKQQTGIIEE
jgi:predicted TIM-barrel fold metal-dependent hydrolase